MIRIRTRPMPKPTDTGYVMAVVDVQASNSNNYGKPAWQACVLEEWDEHKGAWVAVPIVVAS